RSPASMPWSMMAAVIKGMNSSITTSRAVNSGASSDAVLYSLTWLSSVFSICCLSLLSLWSHVAEHGLQIRLQRRQPSRRDTAAQAPLLLHQAGVNLLFDGIGLVREDDPLLPVVPGHAAHLHIPLFPQSLERSRDRGFGHAEQRMKLRGADLLPRPGEQ